MTVFSSPLSIKQRGFTLLEVLLAIAIFAMVSLASFSVFDTVLKSDEHATAKSDRMNHLQKAFLLMERDFNQMAKRSMRIEGEAAREQFIYTEMNHIMTQEYGISFVRAGWTNPGYLIGRGDMQTVAYQLNEEKLERLHFNFVDVVVGEEPKVRPLLSGVLSLKFEYHNGQDWQEKAPVDVLPLAVAIEMELDDLGVVRRHFLVAGEAFSATGGANGVLN